MKLIFIPALPYEFTYNISLHKATKALSNILWELNKKKRPDV